MVDEAVDRNPGSEQAPLIVLQLSMFLIKNIMTLLYDKSFLSKSYARYTYLNIAFLFVIIIVTGKWQ